MTTRIERRQCATCAKNRPLSSYTGTRGRVCAVCQKATSRASARANHLLKTYDMTPEQAAALLKYQGDVCAICRGARDYNLALDHDHALPDGIESWRGFLCKRCNKLLRDVRDSTQILLAAAEYLREPPARRVFDTTPVPTRKVFGNEIPVPT